MPDGIILLRLGPLLLMGAIRAIRSKGLKSAQRIFAVSGYITISKTSEIWPLPHWQQFTKNYTKLPGELLVSNLLKLIRKNLRKPIINAPYVIIRQILVGFGVWARFN